MFLAFYNELLPGKVHSYHKAGLAPGIPAARRLSFHGRLSLKLLRLLGRV